MAWSNVNSFGGVSDKTANQASTTFSTGGTQVGDIAVAIIAVDNNQTTDGDEGAVSSITDDKSQTWVKAAEFCNGQGTAQAGATCSVWYTTLVSTFITNATVNFTNSASRDASAIVVGVFRMDAGSTVSVQATATLANDGADPGSLNATTPSAEFLRIRGIAGETSNTFDLTVTSGWTSFGPAQTAGGSAVTNMAARAEFHISTGTGDASDPTWTAVDCASVYVAFKENLAAPASYLPYNPWPQAAPILAT